MTDKTDDAHSNPEDVERAKALVEAGRDLSQKGDYWAAARKFREAATLDPTSAEAHKELGDALYESYEYEEAAAAYDGALGAYAEESDAAARAEVYYLRGEALYAVRRFEAAADSFRESAPAFDRLANEAHASHEHAAGCKYEGRASDVYNSIGFTLLGLKRYGEARESFEQALARGRKYPYAYHNLASLYWTQGRYSEARKYWDDALYRYKEEARLEEAERENWPGHFINFANMLHEVYGKLEYAERIYRDALAMQGHSASTRAGLMSLHIERAGRADCRADSYCEARRYYEEAKAILADRLKPPKDLDTMIALGELHLAWNDYDGTGRWREDVGKLAECWLTKAVEKDEADSAEEGYTRTAKPFGDLGVVHARRREYGRAIEFFERALRIENDDLTLRSNLAEAYLRDGQLDEAEREYEFVLAVAPAHVESLIGVGEVCLARADAGDADLYEQAAEKFRTALALAEERKGSKRLKDKERAQVHYLRAYALVQSFEGSKLMLDQNLLSGAVKDFKACLRYDPEHYLARRALRKVEKRLGARASQRVLEKLGQYLVLLFSIAVFGFAQYFFYWTADKLGSGGYISLTFGALALMVVSPYLPQILKLKFAGLELEKNSVDQVATLGTLGITNNTTVKGVRGGAALSP